MGSFPQRKILMFYPFPAILTGELHPLHLHHPYPGPEAAFPRRWAQRNQPIFVSPRLFQPCPVVFWENLPVCLIVHDWVLVRDCVCLPWSKSINFSCLKQIRNQEMEHLLKQLGRFYISLGQVRGISPGINDEEMRVIIMIMKPSMIFLWIFNVYWILQAEGAWWKTKKLLSTVYRFIFSWPLRRDLENFHSVGSMTNFPYPKRSLNKIGLTQYISFLCWEGDHCLRSFAWLNAFIWGYEVDLSGALYNEQPAGEINISQWPRLVSAAVLKMKEMSFSMDLFWLQCKKNIFFSFFYSSHCSGSTFQLSWIFIKYFLENN